MKNRVTINFPKDVREYCPKCKCYLYPVKNHECYFCKTKTIKFKE